MPVTASAASLSAFHHAAPSAGSSPPAVAPIRLPSTLVPSPARYTPLDVLPLIRLPAPVPGVAVSPPTTVPGEPASTYTPIAFGAADRPSAVVPMKLPDTTVPDDPDTSTPLMVLPLITFRSAGEVPPTTVPDDPAATLTPVWLPATVRPSGSSPM